MHLCVCVCTQLCVCKYLVLCTIFTHSFTHADFAEVSQVLTFDAERSTNPFRVNIFDDFEREAAIETINLQLSFVEEERSSSLLLLPRQANVIIQDNDGRQKQQYLFTKLIVK